jgi:phage repressor protein C with HTH and peptisase S24 domain
MKKVLLIRRIVGSSMEPTFKPGQIIIASGLRKPAEDDVVVVHHEGREKIKRIKELKDDKIFIVGDNPAASTDSRSFGWLPERVIIGTVLWPHARTIRADGNRKDEA